MRIPIIAANWKMHMTVEEGMALVAALLPRIDPVTGVERVLCPPFTHLSETHNALRATTVRLGAQNVFWELKGPFTGEISPLMLRPLVEYVIIGHSERRQQFDETDLTVNRRLRAAIENGLKPILCVGETGDERTTGQTEAVLHRQLAGSLEGIPIAPDLVIAYEPVWAIGTGVAATPADAQDASAFIRARLEERAGDVAARIRIQYGGSVNASNAAEILRCPDVDGALVGGASLDVAAFAAVVYAAAEVAAGRR